MLLSKTSVYAIRASLYLAFLDRDEFIPIKKMSDKLEISFHYLTKILQQLSANHIVESYKGPNGGVRLLKKGKDITLYEIVAIIDGEQMFTECALGLPGCGVKAPCALHDQWAEAKTNIKTMLEQTTLIELARRGKAENLRLTSNGGFEFLEDDF